MQTQWFVIHTLAGQEQRVKESIERRLKAEEMGEYIKEVLVPMEKVAEVRNGKKTVTMRKLHPGYVYIDMLLLDENRRVLEKPWYFIRETQGIIGFVGGDRPVSHRDLTSLLLKVAGSGSVQYIDWPAEKKAIDIGSFYADSSKLRRATGWAPAVSLDEGLRRAVDFYRANLAHYVDGTDATVRT